MATAKNAAREQLGNIDLSYLDKEKQTAQDIYNTSKGSLENNFNSLLSQIGTNKLDTKKNFTAGRTTVAENAFNQNRLNTLDVGSRIAGKSGLKELGEIGTRIETGRQFSDLANTYYSDINRLNETEKQGRSQYDLDQQGLKNTLNQTLTGIDSRGAEAKNSYNMTLGQLAEQIQGRWDSNANSKAAIAQAERAAARAHQDALNASKQNVANAKRSALNEIVNSGATEDQMRARIQSSFGVNADMATKILQELGIAPIKSFSFDVNKPYTPTNYVNELIGGW